MGSVSCEKELWGGGPHHLAPMTSPGKTMMSLCRCTTMMSSSLCTVAWRASYSTPPPVLFPFTRASSLFPRSP